MSISLKAITLFNFKSFRGKVVIDNFQPFTAIVGPNGSGKSNIMDAISFVLGEKLSILRVKHLNDLVFGAIIGEPAVDGAYVTIVLIKDQKEKSYTRIIQGRDSRYKIGNKIVTRDTYMFELKEFGLNIKAGNFLMPQGYIQYFANNSKELTMMLEEISGSNVYKAEYDRLQLELSKVNQEIHFAYQMKKTQLQQKKFAIIEKTKAEKYLQLQKQYMEEKLKFQLIQLISIKREVESLQNEQKNIKLDMDEYLRNKTNQITLLNHIKEETKPTLFDLLKTEEIILEVEDDIRRKKMEHVDIQDKTVFWQKTLDSARASLDSANNMYDIHKKASEELKNELEIITKKLTELSTEDDIVEFHDSQVNRYMILKTKAESQAKDFINNINDLMHDQQIDQYKLDNQNRSKMELKNKIKIETLGKEQLEAQVQKLQDLNNLFKIRIVEKKEEKQKIEIEIREIEEKTLKLKTDIAKCMEDESDKILQEKKTEIIKKLKECFSGVHGRLFNLCKPIHSCYNVAITKVFGKNMDAIVVDTDDTAKRCIYFLKRQAIGVETFLPLNSIKTKPINDKLRTKLQQTNCKLLYDVVKLSSIEIEKAVLYATKNTIVCETVEDAREKSLENNNYDYVSLDGCFFQKNGFISGGLTDLTAKAKQWENQSVLNKQKKQLKQELENLPQIFGMQSNFDIINKDINRLIVKNEIIEKDIKNIIEEIKIQEIKLNSLQEELRLHDAAILVIQHEMQERDKKIKIIENNINEIKNKIFIDFCKEINVPDIIYYENNLCAYKERLTKRIEIENQRDYINNQLDFESEFNRNAEFENKISNWKLAVEKANTNYEEAYKQEQEIKTTLEQIEIKLLKLKDDYKIKKEKLENIETELVERRSQIGIISKLYLKKQMTYMTIQRKIKEEHLKCETILKECKLEGIIIPMLSEIVYDRDVSSSSSNISTESNVWEIMMNIDFSQISKHIPSSVTDLQNIIKQSKIKLTVIENEFKALQKPNCKADKRVDLIKQQIKETNEKHQELREKFNNISRQFEIVKAKRLKLFSNCLEYITENIDSTYKNLINDQAAQALITLENVEEPYLGGINYNCIPPSKRYQPLQYLSDGENIIVNLAFRFALLRYKPTFFIMDEGDAALDNASVKNFVNYVRSQMKNMQVIVITLNKNLSCHTDRLIGITTQPKTACTESMIFTVPL